MLYAPHEGILHYVYSSWACLAAVQHKGNLDNSSKATANQTYQVFNSSSVLIEMGSNDRFATSISCSHMEA